MPKRGESRQQIYFWSINDIAMKSSGLHKISSLAEGDCLSFHCYSVSSVRPPHYHSDFELLLLPDAHNLELSLGEEAFRLRGAQLVLAGPEVQLGLRPASNQPLAAESGQPLAAASSRPLAAASGQPVPFPSGRVLSIRWPADLLGDRLLGKHHLKPIASLLHEASYCILFPVQTIPIVRDRLLGLQQKKGFAILLDLLALLNELSAAEGKRLTDGETSARRVSTAAESRINSAVAYMKNNYFLPMTLGDVAGKARMTKGAFCRSLRKTTGKSYSESLNEIRIGHICRMLVETSDNVSELAYRAGYRNIHHFHRWFKMQKGCTPRQFREQHTASR